MSDKLERLLNLTLALLETAQPLTSTDVHERVPGYPEDEIAFRRAFERDKDSLREMGVRVTRTAISHTDPPIEGYRIRAEDYYLRDPGLEPDELAAINLAASAVRIDTAHGVEGLWKLGGSRRSADSNGPDARPDLGAAGGAAMAGPVAELPADPNLGPIFGAVAERAQVVFAYNGTERRVDPYRLDYQRGRWYVTGFDHARGEERNFRVDRIQGDVAAGPPRTFERPTTAVPGGPAEPWQFGEGDPVTAYVLIDEQQAPWVRGHLGADAVAEERADGGVVFKVAVTNRPAFRSFVLTFLDHAEILAPAELRQDLLDWVDAILDAEVAR